MIYKARIPCSEIHRLCLPLIQVKDSLDFKFLKAVLSSEVEKDLETTLEPYCKEVGIYFMCWALSREVRISALGALFWRWMPWRSICLLSSSNTSVQSVY